MSRPGSYAAMVSAFMVSYARSRARASVLERDGMAAIGLAPREVRTVILGVTLVAAGILGVTSELEPGQPGPGRRAGAHPHRDAHRHQRIRYVVTQSHRQGGDQPS